MILIIIMTIISINMIFCLIRAAMGPRFSDRLVAVNMVSTKTVLMIALLIKYFEESFLVDICLIYALISFLTVVALTRLLAESGKKKKTAKEDKPVMKEGGENV